MVSSKNNTRNTNEYTQTLHRLNQALNLGTRHGKRWQCSDIQIQRQVVRSVSAFLESVAIHPDSLHRPDLKDTISEVISALVWILDHTNATTLGLTVDAIVKLVTVLPGSFLKPYLVDLVGPLSSLKLNYRMEVAKSWAKALNLVLSIVSSKNEKAILDILERNEIVCYAVSYVRCFSFGTNPVDNFQTMVSLLTTILRRWPRSRFIVWIDDDFMRTMNDVFVNTDCSCEVELLMFFSAIALCGSGATKLLESREVFLEKVVQCMCNSKPHSVQVEAFKLARYLAINEERFSKMTKSCCEPLVKAIICGMRKVSTESGEFSIAEMSVAVEACTLALTTRYGGDHHVFFWKHGIGNVLLDLLLGNSHYQIDQNSGSLEKHFSIAVTGLNSSHLLVLRNYVWDILGWLAIHCKKGYNPKQNGQEQAVNLLILSTCLASVDFIHKQNKICQINIEDTLRSESATRAVLMMTYSPCKFIALKARLVISDTLKRDGKHIMKHFLSTLKYMSSRNSFNRRQITIYVMALTSYIDLPELRSWIVEFSGLKVLLTLVKWCLSNGIIEENLSLYSYSWNNLSCGQICCDVSLEDWEGKDSLLLYSLWGLAELIKHLQGIKNVTEIYSGGVKYSVQDLVETLCEIGVKISAPGVRWFASYALSSLGFYGFPCKISIRIRNALSDTGLSDTRLILKSGERLSAHGVILATRCPSLLRPDNNTGDESFNREIRLSGCVDKEVLLKFMDFVYFGYLKAEEEEHTRLLKTLAKYCNLQFLVQILSQRQPNWGDPFPSFDLSQALGPLGHRFSDVILESNATMIPNWTCDICTSSVPHIHAHKVIFAASCDYLRALFNSGMQESLSQTIKLDLSWEAMVKLVYWFYTDALPNPYSGCLWDKLSVEDKFRELEPYLELCSISKSWFLEDIEEVCSNLIVSHLESESQLCIKIIRVAFGFSLWKLVEAGLNSAAPLYRQLYKSGELENLDETLVDMIRTASVQYTQRGDFK